ncbi:MAG: tRNA preQ1(34) S-adenosylmethionine ribosyltransferase-isomerase QueA [Gammaproteobacteria bacterium]|nr:tRNA preQ1(34) S-adenosylmethionine ribosyltransferase-isomerase QueA [Gammaproteobacteria bacterium]
MLTSEFDYVLPRIAIAQRPVAPRDAARLLDARDLTDRTFRDLPALLTPGDLVVVNNTRVRAARLHGRKEETGGAVEALILTRSDDGHWEALVRPARRLHEGTRLRFGDLRGRILEEPVRGKALLEFEGSDIEALIAAHGEVPLPPYITAGPSDPEDYQTVFADKVGSAAAPTAGLHFSAPVLAELADRGVDVATVDLQVGLDTFRPIDTEHVEHHEMHTERFSVPVATAAAVAEARRRGGRVVAIGTTVVRALEAASVGNEVHAGEDSTDLFIRPGYQFSVVDALVTNFHIPRSSLIVLVAAFLGHRWRSVYATALERGYRFLSFGDAMYAER